MQKIKQALEAAHHELTTLHGLIAADAEHPEQTWQISTNAITDLIDDAINELSNSENHLS